VRHLDEARPEGVENESVEQVAFADRILVSALGSGGALWPAAAHVRSLHRLTARRPLPPPPPRPAPPSAQLNKIDLVTAEEKAAVLARLRRINAAAEVIEAERCAVDLGRVLGVGAFDLARVLEAEPDFLDEGAEHRHDDSVTSVGIAAPGECDAGRLNAWLSALLRDKGADLFRSKGVLAVAGAEERYVFQVREAGAGKAGAWRVAQPALANQFCPARVCVAQPAPANHF
jgi:G3E family GTPase